MLFNMSEVNWRDIPGYEGLYQVSDDGQVRSLARTCPAPNGGIRDVPETILRPAEKRGYLQVCLFDNGKRKYQNIHRLVALAYLGPCPDGMQVCHNNGRRGDNRLQNLRYDTPSENQRDSIRHGTHVNASKTHCANGHPFSDENTRVEKNGKRTCKVCQRDQAADRYARDPDQRERVRERNQRYYTKNSDDLAAYGRAYYAANRETAQAKSRARWTENAEELNARRRADRAADPEKAAKLREQGRRSYAAHAEKRREEGRRRYAANRNKVLAQKREYYQRKKREADAV